MIKHLLTTLGIALLLTACTSAFQKAGYRAAEADCRLQGYLPSSPDYRDCVKVGKHQVDVADMQHRIQMMQSYQRLGTAWAPQPQTPAPNTFAPQPAKQMFCYPGAGYTYCQ